MSRGIVFAVPTVVGSVEVLQKQATESRKFPYVPVSSDSFFFLNIIYTNKNGTNGFKIMFAFMNALYFHSSI